MKRLLACAMVVGLAGAWAVFAEDAAQMPEMPKPVKEHEWLKQLQGEWEVKTEMNMEGVPPMTSTGTESVRPMGGFWVVAEGTGAMEGMDPMQSLMTLGFDIAKGKYVGTWSCSVGDYLWTYVGNVDKSGKILTLETEGPCPMKEGKIVPFKDVIEIKDKDHRETRSSMQNEDGSWTEFVKMEYTRK